jgi:hypothetical protein
MQRRFYIVKFDRYILYVDAIIKLGVDDAVKEEFWHSIETITLPAPKK